MNLGGIEVRASGIAAIQWAVLDNMRKQIRTRQELAVWERKLMVFRTGTLLAAYVEEGLGDRTPQRSYR